MKKILLLLIFIIIVYFLLPFCSSCEEISESDISKAVPDEYKEIFEGDGETLKTPDGNFFLSFILSLLGENLKSGAALALVFLSIAALNSLFLSFSERFSPSLSSAFSYAVTLTSGIFVFTEISSLFALITNSVEKLNLFLGKLTPIFTAAYIASGSVTSAGVASLHFTLIMSLIQNIVCNVLSPLLSVCLMMITISALSGRKEIAALSDFIGKAFTFCVSFIMLIVTVVFTYQTLISSSTDALAIRAAKFVSRSLPVVGSALSEASTTILGSFSVIKNTCGGVGIAVILLCLLPPLLKLLISKSAISLSSALSGALSCPPLTSLLTSASKLLGYGTALLVISDITAILSISVIMVAG